MSNLVVPIDSKAARFIWRHWPLISAALMCVLSIGIAKGKYSDLDGRVGALEQAHPDATAALTRQNADDVRAMRLQIDRIREDVSATRVDVARLCASLGVPSTGLSEGESEKSATFWPAKKAVFLEKTSNGIF